MTPERTKLPTKEEIDGIDSIDALSNLLDDVDGARLKIETDLEFRSDDGATEEWAGRARGALLAHRICERNIRKRISRIQAARKAPQAPTKDPAAKLRAKEVQAALEAAGAQRKLAAAEQVKVGAIQGLRKAIERTSFLVQFHLAAHDLLDGDTCSRVHAEAQRRLAAAAEEAIGEITA